MIQVVRRWSRWSHVVSWVVQVIAGCSRWSKVVPGCLLRSVDSLGSGRWSQVVLGGLRLSRWSWVFPGGPMLYQVDLGDSGGA